MSAKPPFVLPSPDFWFTLFTLILLTSFVPLPVTSRPSTSFESTPDHHDHHENTDIGPQQSEDKNNDSQEETVTEIKTFEEQELQEEPEFVDNEPSYAEDYPQQDMPAVPMDDAADNGGRRGEAKRSKSFRHGGKGGRRNETEGMTEDLSPDADNRTINNGSAPNRNANDSKASQQLMRHNQEIDHADSDKQERLKEIMHLVTIYRSQSMALNPSPTNGPSDGHLKLVNLLNIFHPPPIDTYPMLSRSFHPSCSLPNNTNVRLWVDGDSMNLLFNLTYPAQQNTTVTIVAATLRLYKLAQDNHTLKAHSCKPAGVSSPNPDSDNNEQEPERETPGVPEVPEVPEVPATPRTVMADDDKQIRVSVYWYTQPLKKNKGKRKLLDSRMLPVYGKGGWIEFNVGSAAGQWYQPGKNFGLVVEVENEDGQLLKASDYFTAMNCSEASTARPLPGVLLQTAQSSYASSRTGLDISHIMGSWPDSTYANPISGNFPDNGRRKKETDRRDEDAPRRVTSSPYVYTFLFPVIDMCTVQVPAQEATNAAFVNHAQHLLTQLMAACRTTHIQNYADFILMDEPPNYPAQPRPVREETNKTATTEVINSNNASHGHRDGHKKDQCRNILHAIRLAIPEDLSPSMQESLCSVKIRHLRHHLDEKHRQRNHSGNHQHEKAMKRQVADEENERESEEIKEQVTWTDENGREFREKITFEDVIRSSNPLDTSVRPQRDSDR